MITIPQHVMMNIQAEYPCSFDHLVNYILIQSNQIHEGDNRRRVDQATDIVVEALNKMLRAGYIELYDTGDCFTLGERYREEIPDDF